MHCCFIIVCHTYDINISYVRLNHRYVIGTINASDFSNIGPHMPKIPTLQSHCSPIRQTMYLRCVYWPFWTSCRPDTHGHHACSGSISYIDHVSMHTGRTSVGYWLMSEQRSVDFRSISISQGLVLLWTMVDRRFLTMCQGWLGDEVDRWKHRKCLIVVPSPKVLS